MFIKKKTRLFYLYCTPSQVNWCLLAFLSETKIRYIACSMFAEKCTPFDPLETFHSLNVNTIKTVLQLN
jgi:hypothetical protein